MKTIATPYAWPHAKYRESTPSLQPVDKLSRADIKVERARGDKGKYGGDHQQLLNYLHAG